MMNSLVLSENASPRTEICSISCSCREIPKKWYVSAPGELANPPTEDRPVHYVTMDENIT